MSKLPPPPIEDILASRKRPYEVAVDPTTGRVSVKTDGTTQDHASALDALDRIGVIHQHMLKPGYHMPGTEPAVSSVSLRVRFTFLGATLRQGCFVTTRGM